MSSPDFVVSAVRLGLLLAPAGVVAHQLRCRFAKESGAAAAALVEVILAVAWMVVLGEGLGLVGQLRLWWLISASWLGAGLVLGLIWRCGTRSASAVNAGRLSGPRSSNHSRSGPIAAALAVWLVAAQWIFATADALGSGMTSFDSLWYHMPIAARFAETGSVTKILFPEADPSNAFFPANSELLHGLGIIAFGNDFLSPFLNCGWLSLGLLASWCIGARWRVQWWTLCSGAVLFVLPMLGTYEPGQALNDIAGLALLAAGLALLLAPQRGWPELGVAALAFGLAIGTKWTFLAPALAMAAIVIWLERRRSPVRVTGTMLGGILLTGGWWYLRDLIYTGSPLGLRLKIGPIQLPGAASPISTASRESVSAAIGQNSVWSSRFAPGLDHALGPLWPLLLAIVLGGVLLALLAARREPLLAALGFVTVISGVAYVFTPATAQDVSRTASFFTYDLRFLAPALELGLLLLPPILATRAPRLLPVTGWVLVAIGLSAQLEHTVWPTQTTRHIAFLAVTAIGAGFILLALRHPPVVNRTIRAVGASALAVAVLAAGYVVEHHYFHRRYLTNSSALGQIYGWAQTVHDTHIALYGTVLQYPLYGATDSNTVTYLGQPAAHDGYRPIAACARFQHVLQTQGFEYLVLTTGPTGEVPTAWTQADRDLVPILHPTAEDWVYKIVQRTSAADC